MPKYTIPVSAEIKLVATIVVEAEDVEAAWDAAYSALDNDSNARWANKPELEADKIAWEWDGTIEDAEVTCALHEITETVESA